MNRLADIFLHAQPDGFPRVIEFLIAAEQQNLAVQPHLAQLADERQPVHDGHADIAQHQIRRLLLGYAQCLHPAAGHAVYLHPHLLPWQYPPQIAQNRGFIVNQ
ncbi:hypothetical protein D3C73_1186890 [compost metagenome]